MKEELDRGKSQQEEELDRGNSQQEEVELEDHGTRVNERRWGKKLEPR